MYTSVKVLNLLLTNKGIQIKLVKIYFVLVISISITVLQEFSY